jgi:hypothetical protein
MSIEHTSPEHPSRDSIESASLLLGFTGSTFTARYGSIIYTYEENGMTLYSKAA